MYGVLLGFVIATLLFYHRASLAVWTISIIIYYVAYLKWIGCHVLSSTLILTMLAIIILLQFKSLRRRFITSFIFKRFQGILPTISQTEREAINAGSITFEGELFKGNPHWHDFLKGPTCHLTEEEQAFLDGPTETLCAMLNDWDITHNYLDLPPAVWTFIKEQGFFGLIIPKEYGGKAFSAYAHSQIITKVSGISIAASVTISVPNSLGPAELLLHYGTKQQQEYYLPRLARGEEIPCFALTSLDAGSDAGSMTDYGIVTQAEFEGQTTIGIRLNFSKRYITLAPIATVIGLAFKLYDPDHLLGTQESLGITCALIPRNTVGMTIGRRHFPLNCPFQNGPIIGKNVFIPLDWIIGGTAQIGKGWRMLTECLATGRAITLPSNATGGAKLLSLACSAYVRIRHQFGLPIGRFEGVQEPLAQIAAFAYLMDAARKETIAQIDAGEKPAVASAIVKYHVTELGRKCIIHGMDLHGGKGIFLGPSNYLGRGYQAAPVAITVEGANILTRNLMIFGQGVIRCHPYLYAEMQAIKNHDVNSGLIKFDKAFFKHGGFLFSNIIRTMVLSLTSARIVRVPHSRLKRYLQLATRFSTAFALLTDVSLMVYGGQIKRKESISARLGDVLSHLYLLSSVIKHFHEEGEQEADLPLASYAADYCLFEIQRSIIELLHNYKNRFAATILHCLIFPFGKRFAMPTDRKMKQITTLLLRNSKTRDRLIHGVSLGYPLFAQLQDAMDKVIMAEPIEKAIHDAKIRGDVSGYSFIEYAKDALQKQFITESEYELVIAADAVKRNVLKVDDFTTEELKTHAS